MSTTTKFRIPDTGLYLRNDGRLSPVVEPGETAVDLTSEHAQLLEVVYHGQALKQLTTASSSGFNGLGRGDGIDIVITEANNMLTHFTGVDFFWIWNQIKQLDYGGTWRTRSNHGGSHAAA